MTKERDDEKKRVPTTLTLVIFPPNYDFSLLKHPALGDQISSNF